MEMGARAIFEKDGEYYVLQEDYDELEEENKKLKEKIELLDNENMCLNAETKDREEENRKLKETIKDHQLYEEKLEHRIIEFEELLHGE